MRLPQKTEMLLQYPYFHLDKEAFFPEATLFFMTGSNLENIIKFLCSEIGFFVFTKYYMGPVFDSTGFRFKKEYLLNLPIPNLCIDEDEMHDYETRLAALIGLSSEEMELIANYKTKLLSSRS